MKNNSLQIRLSDKRKHKLMLYAAQKERTITSLIDEWIDSLKISESGNSSSTNITD